MLLYPLLAAATSGSHGLYSNPATTCIKTTIKANGHTTDTSVAAPSGNITFDRYALQVVRELKAIRERGQTYSPETVYALVEIFDNEDFANKPVEIAILMSESCSLPQAAADGA